VLVPARSDNPLAQFAARALARSLPSEGVRFFEYLPRMLHSKVTVVDERWATVGSANTDYRSFFINQELNLVCRDEAVCGRSATWRTRVLCSGRRRGGSSCAPWRSGSGTG
jgi:cardiolipin synthase